MVQYNTVLEYITFTTLYIDSCPKHCLFHCDGYYTSRLWCSNLSLLQLPQWNSFKLNGNIICWKFSCLFLLGKVTQLHMYIYILAIIHLAMFTMRFKGYLVVYSWKTALKFSVHHNNIITPLPLLNTVINIVHQKLSSSSDKGMSFKVLLGRQQGNTTVYRLPG